MTKVSVHDGYLYERSGMFLLKTRLNEDIDSQNRHIVFFLLINTSCNNVVLGDQIERAFRSTARTRLLLHAYSYSTKFKWNSYSISSDSPRIYSRVCSISKSSDLSALERDVVFVKLSIGANSLLEVLYP